MKALACVALLITAGVSAADTESDLRKLCAEQERQIVALEKQIDSLHSELALQRRRARGNTTASLPTPATTTPAESYKVQDGDTLSSIARRYKTSASALMKENGIKDPTRLRVGQTLTITSGTTPAKEVVKEPAKKPAPAVAKKPSSPNYKVRAGDTFYKIARNHALTVAKLEALNPGIDPARIIIGQQIAVAGTPRKAPSLAPSGTRTISTKTPAPKKTASAPAPKKPAPKPVAKKETPKPTPKPEPKPEPKPAPKTISSIIVMEEISFEKFAGRHGSTTQQLNALNGLTLKDSTVLAKGSELYVPGR